MIDSSEEPITSRPAFAPQTGAVCRPGGAGPAGRVAVAPQRSRSDSGALWSSLEWFLDGLEAPMSPALAHFDHRTPTRQLSWSSGIPRIHQEMFQTAKPNEQTNKQTEVHVIL